MPEQSLQTETAAAPAEQASRFQTLMIEEIKPTSADVEQGVKSGVDTLAKEALRHTKLISADAVKTIDAIIAAIDQKLSQQISLIMHHPDFQAMEGTWRGLDHLVRHTESSVMLKLKVFNVTKKEVGKVMEKFKGAPWDQSPLFKKIYSEEYGAPGAAPYGCLLGDYYFDHSPADVEILQGISQISAAAHCPFISAAAPSLFGMQSWQQLEDPRDLKKIQDTPAYAPWRSLRDSPDSIYVGLTLPRFLARLPYGSKTKQAEGFDFEEDVEGADHKKYTWSNACYAMGGNITRAFAKYGWCARIRGPESGGMIEGLPCHTFPTDDGTIDMKCPTEIAITNRREQELADTGMMPLSHWKNTDFSVFVGAQSLHKPAAYDDPDATANENLSSRLPYMFATCRFAHYLNAIALDKIGSFKERQDMQDWLTRWITKYVCRDPKASEEVKAQLPLAAAEVAVQDVEGNPGYYKAQIWLRPHFQLEGLKASLRLVAKLPSQRAAG